MGQMVVAVCLRVLLLRRNAKRDKMAEGAADMIGEDEGLDLTDFEVSHAGHVRTNDHTNRCVEPSLPLCHLNERQGLVQPNDSHN